LGLTISFMSTTSVDAVLNAFRADSYPGGPLTFGEADEIDGAAPARPGPQITGRAIELLRRQGTTPAQIAELIDGVSEAAQVVRLGRVNRWTACLEQSTTRGGDPAVMALTSSNGEETVTYSYTQTISTLSYARDGALVSSLDTTCPQLRSGAEQSYFDDLIAEVVGKGNRILPANVAEMLQLRFDITINRELLEGRLAAAVLRP
jgi:hypothetical protein